MNPAIHTNAFGATAEGGKELAIQSGSATSTMVLVSDTNWPSTYKLETSVGCMGPSQLADGQTRRYSKTNYNTCWSLGNQALVARRASLEPLDDAGFAACVSKLCAI